MRGAAHVMRPEHALILPTPQSIIVRAQGEARSAELIGEAVRQNKGFLQLRRLEAARDIATLLAASDNRVMLDSQSLLLNGTKHVVSFRAYMF